MPGVLWETDPTMPVDVVTSFPGKAGFAFGFGASSSFQQYYTRPGGFLSVGNSYINSGIYNKDYPGSVLANMACQADLDYIDQDEMEVNVDSIIKGPANVGIGYTGGLTYNNGDGADRPVPILYGGNAFRSFTGWLLYNDPAVISPPLVSTIVGGQQVVTGLGFQPDFITFMGYSSAGGGNFDGGRWSFGVADSDLNQWAGSAMGIFASAFTGIGGLIGQPTRYSEFRTDSCILGMKDDYATFNALQSYAHGSLASMDPDGFTLNLDLTGAYSGYFLITAFKLDDLTKSYIKVGTHTQGDTVGQSGLALPPEGMFICGDSFCPSIDVPLHPGGFGPTGSDKAMFFMGAMDDTNFQRGDCGGCGTGGGVNPFNYYDDTVVSCHSAYDYAPTAKAEGTMTSDGWDMSWSVDDGGARPFGSVTFVIPQRGLPAMNHRIPAER